jgi:hypothetical protein
MDWKISQQVFEVDGSLRDILVFNTTLADWQKMMDWLRTSSYTLKFRGLENETLPEQVQTIFARNEEILSFMSVDVGEATLNCHFDWEKDIEFDLDPREMASEAVVQRVFDFMAHLGNLIGKQVDLCPEGGYRHPIALFRYDPAIAKLVFNPDNHEWLKEWAD